MGSSHLIPLQAVEKQIRLRSKPKGRIAEPEALEEVRALLKDEPRRRDLLIEHLHKVQDRYGHLSSRHLTALAREMNLPMAEVYEVASFYHHFDIVRDGEAAPPALTVRVCESLSCEMAGAREMLHKLPALLGRDVRVLGAPCLGRCEQAPAVVVGQHPVACASVEKVAGLVKEKSVKHPRAADRAAFDPVAFVEPSNSPGAITDIAPGYMGYAAYRKAGARCTPGLTTRPASPSSN